MNDAGTAQPPWRRFMCVNCGYVYDEALGVPADNLPPGTRWEDLPPTWTCPDCGAPKEDFEQLGD